jgi:hypothetical protein
MSAGLPDQMPSFLPNGNLAQKIVFCFKLLHLPVPYSAILAVEEVVLNLVPWFDIFILQSHLNPSDEPPMSVCQGLGGVRTYWLLVSATIRGKSTAADPLSFHIRKKKCVARTWTR